MGRDGQKDFDFLIGTWKVRNRRLRERLVGSQQWDEFGGTSVARAVWGGLANMDEYEAHAPFGLIQGLTVRLYEPATGQWRLHWANRANGIFDAPMIGRFEDGRGEFYNQELHGGRTWETNWIMESTRA